MPRKYNPDKLRQAAADWDVHHALVAAVRRLVRLSGGVQEAKDVIDAVAEADALWTTRKTRTNSPQATNDKNPARTPNRERGSFVWIVTRRTLRPYHSPRRLRTAR